MTHDSDTTPTPNPPDDPNADNNVDATNHTPDPQPNPDQPESQPSAAPAAASGQADAQLGTHEAPAASRNADNDSAEAATMHRYVDDKPGLRARIASSFADIVLWSFVLACFGYLIFDIETVLDPDETGRYQVLKCVERS